MSTTTAYGYKLPATGDRGTWWTNLTDNWTRASAHSHDGVDSALIYSSVLDKHTVSVSSASWVATSGGTYRQLITHPSTITFPKAVFNIYINSGTESGSQVFLSVEKVSSTTYYLYINDNTLDLKVVYA